MANDLFQALKDAQADLESLKGSGTPAQQLQGLAEQEIAKFKEQILLSTKSLKEYGDAQAKMAGATAVHQRQLQESAKAQADQAKSAQQMGNSFGSAVKQFAAPGGGAKGALSAASSIGAGLQASGNPYAMAAGAGIQAASSILSTIGDFVKTANPGAMMQLDTAFEDIQATIGSALLPVIQMLTPMVQTFGDFIASIIPDQAVLNEYMKQWQPLIQLFGKTLQGLAPILSTVLTAWTEFETKIVKGWVHIFVYIIEYAVKTFRSISAALTAIKAGLGPAGLVKAMKDAFEKEVDFSGTLAFDKKRKHGFQEPAKPELSSIADAWKRAQTAAQGDSNEVQLMQKQLAAQLDIAAAIDRLALNQTARFSWMAP